MTCDTCCQAHSILLLNAVWPPACKHALPVCLSSLLHPSCCSSSRSREFPHNTSNENTCWHVGRAGAPASRRGGAAVACGAPAAADGVHDRSGARRRRRRSSRHACVKDGRPSTHSSRALIAAVGVRDRSNFHRHCQVLPRPFSGVPCGRVRQSSRNAARLEGLVLRVMDVLQQRCLAFVDTGGHVVCTSLMIVQSDLGQVQPNEINHNFGVCTAIQWLMSAVGHTFSTSRPTSLATPFVTTELLHRLPLFASACQ